MLREGAASQRLRWIPPGRFRMGSPADEEGRDDDEGPTHEVVISRGYWLFDTPCCQDLWEAVLGAKANESRFRGPRRPVENVSWDEAVAFTERLNARVSGLNVRLPREAEWEYACRAGTTGARYGALDAIAWQRGNSQDQTHEVGLLAANPWGLYDMLGNVWEWCQDNRRVYRNRAVVDPDGGSGAGRVIRGGGWYNAARYARAADRSWNAPEVRSDSLGFRCLSSGREEKAEPDGSGRSGAEQASRASARSGNPPAGENPAANETAHHPPARTAIAFPSSGYRSL
ncbi:MAG TPA: formylglycine-generating enzyme family protein [Urbifossiella sp.]|nr:formylglycine-generating enzyme family protein [Urbifossiella sp.]